MNDMDTNVGMNFSFPTDSTKIIKVIGVGGGGVNAVDYMYKNGIHGVNFAVCNTDKQSFDGVDVPVKVVLGAGLGAGGDPQKAREEFEKSRSEVEKLLDDGTRMVFITTGMGGGTGTGAGPLLAKMAKTKGLLTVGIVTIPFLFERVPRIITALDAVEEMRENVDALIVINNEKLKVVYTDFELEEAFKKPNEVLAMAVKSIAEIITVKGIINRDFNDVKATMKDGGVALVSYGFGRGENRLDDAIQETLNSPLLSNNNVYTAKRLLLYISSRRDARLKVEELNKHVDDFMSRFDDHIKMNWGYGADDSLTPEQEVKFTLIATGFDLETLPDVVTKWMDKVQLEELQRECAKRQNDIKRIQSIYGKNLESNATIKRVSPSSIVTLTMEEMDDDALIEFLEKNPTYNRSANEVAAKRKPAKEPEKDKSSAPVVAEEHQTTNSVPSIDFF
jgi:cell division protein FtsZ